MGHGEVAGFEASVRLIGRVTPIPQRSRPWPPTLPVMLIRGRLISTELELLPDTGRNRGLKFAPRQATELGAVALAADARRPQLSHCTRPPLGEGDCLSGLRLVV
ncbi:protocadherin beta 12 [Mycolicibacterium canariasense]|uniref:Protocadherin beta 12 n=1 Tax=Mycolicibacterium canariasense TaxID=228230 RepID=A0A100WE81_MYCCR|nr:protocadherin beta 12 [Mycolicibacterium canariasense]